VKKDIAINFIHCYQLHPGCELPWAEMNRVDNVS